MAHFLILGAGRQGAAVGAFLLERFEDTTITFVDTDGGRLDAAQKAQTNPRRADKQHCDISSELDELDRLLWDCDCVVSCVPFFYNSRLTRLAITHGKPFCDLGGNVEVVRRQLALDAQAREAGVAIVPDCGLAPGSANVLAEYWRNEWKYKAVKILCGGLPQNPSGVLRWQADFSLHGLLNEYLEPCQVSRGGKLITIEGLSEVETVTGLPAPGEFEAFATSGGASLGPRVYAAKGVDYEYKTIRYPGHRNAIKAMQEMGFFDHQPRTVRGRDHSRAEIVPRDVAASLMEQACRSDRKDVVLLRVIVKGERDGQPVTGQIDLVDRADERFTAMERTTGFSAAIVAAFITGLYEGPAPTGAAVPFQVLPPRLLIDELARAGVDQVEVQPAET
jgi:lysine 6-dehydrogenase